MTKFEEQQIKEAANWLSVSSSNVKAICWRKNTGDGPRHGLGVWFAPEKGKQAVYWYHAPFSVFQSMRVAKSKGKFVHRFLIPNYPNPAGPYQPGE